MQPVLAGGVAALVGFASSFAVVLAGLRAVGATESQAASGLLVLCLVSGLCAAWLGLRHRLPMSVAWSTPGAALLVATGPMPGGWPAAVGAFLVSGLLIVAAGLFPVLGRAVAAIPKPIAGAMLAGVLLPLCTAPVRALVEVPLMAAPVLVCWLVLHRFARPWAVPGALVVAAGVIALTTSGGGGGGLRPVIEVTVPQWSLPAMIGLALPLFVVTMAAQNVPGTAVLVGYGYRPPLGSALRATGLASLAAAPAGGHAVNLAAITAALAAGPDAHPDPNRRWIASVTNGVGLALLGLGAGAVTTLVGWAPPVLIEAVAGLALLGALATSLTSALADPDAREAAVVTLVVTASGVSLAGIGGAFWGLIAGCLMLVIFRRRSTTPSTPTPPAPTAPTAPRQESVDHAIGR
ncbi:benzoate/H(+) symporter BenE family transporter [Micromonospora gifhornensis]|uniref:benzoate/H(+) symporter BenE family transporter n=1 Tax=Micromonospora gifhornensis TaxID=84594 RepID=UPI00365FD20E